MATGFQKSPEGQMGENSGDLSTASSACDSEGEFVVDKILAQSVPEKSDDDEEEMYLVRWEGYPDEQCTWEPKESFLNPETLEQWEYDKSHGQILGQDEVGEIVRKMDAYAEAEEYRMRKRRIRDEQLANKGKLRPAVDSKANKNLALGPVPQLYGSRDSASSRVVKPSENTAIAGSCSSGHFHGLPLPRATAIHATTFQGIGVEPKAHRSPHHPPSTRPKGIPGAHFRTLRTKYRHQKAGRNEPAPDLAQIKLKPATDIVAAAGDDIAHILPAGIRRPTPSINSDLPSIQPITNQVDELQPGHAISSNALQMPTAPVTQQCGSVRGNIPHIANMSNSAVSTAASTQNRHVHRLPNGRFWLHGEVLIHLTLHEQVVGDVRVGGLPNWFRTKLISLKVEHQVLLDFHIVETRQYDALCRGRSNDLIANAYIAPFEDSQAAVAELADSLDYKNRAALWYHPDTPYVLVAYAAASEEWQFLDRGYAFPPESQIHLALRNGMPKIETLATLQLDEVQQINSGSGDAMAKPVTKLTPPDSLIQAFNAHESSIIAARFAEKETVANVIRPNLGSRAPSSSKALSTSDSSSTEAYQPEPTISVVPRADDIHDSEIFLHKDLTSSRLVGNNVESDDECSESSPETEERASRAFEFTVLNGGNINTAFQNQFGISYNYLTRLSVMPSPRMEMLDPGRARFYLAFPLPCQPEMEALRAFLSNHTLPNLICTSAEPQGWDGFKTILGDKSESIGVIILHAKYTSYSGLPGLAKLLKMVNINIFSLSLRRVLPFCQSQTHITRLFPNGTAILLTESAMAEQPERTLAILRWFSHTVKTKRGTWKIVLVPNVRRWLRQRAMHAGTFQACFLDMLTEVSELSHGQPIAYRSLVDEESEAESLNGYDDEVGKASLVVSPASIPAYDRCLRKANRSTEAGGDNVSVERDKVLIEWFAGWAATNVQRHRKFPAISGVASFLTDVSGRWGHIEVLDPDQYMLQNKVAFQRPSSTDPPNKSPG